MPLLQNAHFHVIRDTLEAGSICEIQYQYELLFEKPEIELGIHLDCWAVLCGHGLMHDNALGQSRYDVHRHQAQQSRFEAQRKFIVPCDVLNEALGLDEIYLRIFAHASNGAELSIQTATIRDHF